MGILYSNYQTCQSVVSIVYGEPISFSHLYDEYKANPAKAYNKAQEYLSQEIKKYMIHIEKDEYYDTIDFLQTYFAKEILKEDFPQYPNHIESGQESVKRLLQLKNKDGEDFESIHHNVRQYFAKTKRLSAQQRVLLLNWSPLVFFMQTIAFLVLSPLILLSHLLILPASGTSLLVQSFIKDPQFKSSVKFAVSLIVFPLFFFIELAIFVNLGEPFHYYYFFIIYFVALLFASQTLAWTRRFFSRSALLGFWLKNSKLFKQSRILVNEIKGGLSFL